MIGQSVTNADDKYDPTKPLRLSQRISSQPPPMIRPTKGSQAIVQRIPRSVHDLCGSGTIVYIPNVISNSSNSFIIDLAIVLPNDVESAADDKPSLQLDLLLRPGVG